MPYPTPEKLLYDAPGDEAVELGRVPAVLCNVLAATGVASLLGIVS